MKTLHPRVHGGLLYKRGNVKHEAQARECGFEPIDLVVVNLYPFAETIAKRLRRQLTKSEEAEPLAEELGEDYESLGETADEWPDDEEIAPLTPSEHESTTQAPAAHR